MEQEVVFLLAVIAGQQSGYVNVCMARGGALMGQSLFRTLVGTCGTLALVAAFVWGIMNLDWWWPVGGFVGASVLTSTFTSPATLYRWFSVQPALDLGCLALVGFLWFG